jgi:hypothetical protein
MTKQILGLSIVPATPWVALAQQPKPAAPVPAKKPAAATPASRVDTIIALVKGGMSESLVLSTIRKQGKAYELSVEDIRPRKCSTWKRSRLVRW